MKIVFWGKRRKTFPRVLILLLSEKENLKQNYKPIFWNSFLVKRSKSISVINVWKDEWMNGKLKYFNFNFSLHKSGLAHAIIIQTYICLLTNGNILSDSIFLYFTRCVVLLSRICIRSFLYNLLLGFQRISDII